MLLCCQRSTCKRKTGGTAERNTFFWKLRSERKVRIANITGYSPLKFLSLEIFTFIRGKQRKMPDWCTLKTWTEEKYPRLWIQKVGLCACLTHLLERRGHSREELLKRLRRQSVAQHSLGLCLQFSWLCSHISNPKTRI